MNFDFSLVRQHPVATLGAVAIGGIVLISLMRQGSAAQVDAQAASAFDSAAAGYDLQARAIQADVAKAQMGISGQLQLAQIAGDVQLALAKENNAAALAGTNTAAAVQMAQIASAGQIASQQVAAQLEANRQATQVQQATISAGLAQFLAGTEAQVTLGKAQLSTMQNIAQITADVQKTQIIQTAAVQRAQIKAAQSNSQWGAVAKIAGAALMLI